PMSTQHVELRIDLDLGPRYTVVSGRIEEAISETTSAVIEVASTEDLALEDALFEDTSLSICVGGLPLRTWRLRASRTRFVGSTHAVRRYEIELHPRFWFLRLTRNTRKFRDVDAQHVIDVVLREGYVPNRFQIARPTVSRSYCVQYRESNHAFVERLLEF